MRITEAQFAGSSTETDRKPATDGKASSRSASPELPEFAFIGRSNVGKSSLINSLCNNASLAMTSARPGKTRVVNRFLINRSWYLVDLPGYGYAKASQKERQDIEGVIRRYLNFSNGLQLLFVLIDSRHPLMAADASFLREVGGSDIPFAVIFTKADKNGPVANAAMMEENKQKINDLLGTVPPCFLSSSRTGAGKEEILQHIEQVLALN